MDWIGRLAGALGMLTYFFVESNDQERLALTPTIWTDLFQRLSHPLGVDSEIMSQLAEGQGVNNYNYPSMSTSPVDEFSPPEPCRVCMDRRPSVVLKPCSHVFCRACALQVCRCPVCRGTILGRQQLFF